MNRIALLTFVALALWPSMAAAESLPVPTTTPILVISGNIQVSNVDGTAQFDRPMLEEMMDTVIDTKTPWFDGVSRFEGVLMADLMKRVGAVGETVTATALNDYVTEIPLADFEEFGVILALKHDGEFMSVRDKGPLFIVYPYDDAPELQNQTYFGRSAWQVATLTVR